MGEEAVADGIRDNPRRAWRGQLFGGSTGADGVRFSHRAVPHMRMQTRVQISGGN